MISHVVLMSFAGEKIAKQFVAGRHDTEQTPAPWVQRRDGARQMEACPGSCLAEVAACLKKHPRVPEPKATTGQLGGLR